MPLEIVAWSTNCALVNFLPPPFVILVVVAKLESSLPHDKFASSCIMVATVLLARINNTVTLGYNPSTDTLSSFFFHSVN